jgi:hypothetical protein
MKKYIPHLIALMLITGIFIYAQLTKTSEMSYWNFLTYKYVLNIGVALVGIVLGYGIKNYLITLAGATFALAIYCLAFMFDSKEFFATFFLAIYTVFLGFATLANLVRHYKDWVLTQEVVNN